METAQSTDWTPEFPTPVQLKEFFAQIENGSITREKLEAFLGCSIGHHPRFNVARTILKNDFIAPDDIVKAYNYKIAYNDDKLQYLVETFPSEEVIKWCRGNNFILIAGPPIPLSLMDIYNLDPKVFSAKTFACWYLQLDEIFPCADKVSDQWLMLRKSIIANSTNQGWIEQQRILAAGECVPNIAEAAWGIASYKKMHDHWLFVDLDARTSSQDLNGNPVSIGCTSYGGIHIYNFVNDSKLNNLGLISLRKNK
jgi:hypothetical protein